MVAATVCHSASTDQFNGEPQCLHCRVLAHTAMAPELNAVHYIERWFGCQNNINHTTGLVFYYRIVPHLH